MSTAGPFPRANAALRSTTDIQCSTPEELGRFIRSETTQRDKIIRDLGLKIE